MKGKKIIVIGGGVTGLKAALDLAKAGLEVTLLEGRDRLGGRIYTTQANDGITPIELGASYWEGINSSPFYQKYFSFDEVDILKAHSVRLNEKQSTFISLNPQFQLEHILDFYHIAKEKLTDAEIKGAGKTFQQYINAIDLSDLSDAERHWTKRFLENCLQHHCTGLSLGGFPTFHRESKVNALEAWNDEDADFCFVKDGYHKVIEQLHQECQAAGVNIILHSPVIKISDRGMAGVEVQTTTEKIISDKVISTLPIGVFKEKAATLFSPPLSAEKRQTLNTIGVHDATRVILEFTGEPFWDNWQGPYLYVDIPDSPTLLEFRNAYPLCGKAILLTGKYSAVARKLYTSYPSDKARAEQKLIEMIMQDLKSAFPHKNIPNPIHTIVYCWTHDPFARGAYPYRTKDITEQMQQALERPEGNIYFAGADFSRFGFSVHHGYANGQKVAAEIINNSLKLIGLYTPN